MTKQNKNENGAKKVSKLILYRREEIFRSAGSENVGGFVGNILGFKKNHTNSFKYF